MAKKVTASQLAMDKLLPHITMSLKSFDLNLSAVTSQTFLAHLQSLYKKKKYYFYIQQTLDVKTVNGIKFKATMDFMKKNDINYIVICKEFDNQLTDFYKRNDMAFKIIKISELSELAMKYIDAKEREVK